MGSPYGGRYLDDSACGDSLLLLPEIFHSGDNFDWIERVDLNLGG